MTHIAVSKYADHLPLNRQIEIFSREGVHLSASTVSNWMTATAQCIEPIYNELRETLKASRYVQADETPHKVLESEKPGSLHQGYMWVFYLPHCKSPYIEYHPGRSSSALGTLLSGKTEIVQSDGYAVYDVFDKLEGRYICAAGPMSGESLSKPKAMIRHRHVMCLMKLENFMPWKTKYGKRTNKCPGNQLEEGKCVPDN